MSISPLSLSLSMSISPLSLLLLMSILPSSFLPLSGVFTRSDVTQPLRWAGIVSLESPPLVVFPTPPLGDVVLGSHPEMVCAAGASHVVVTYAGVDLPSSRHGLGVVTPMRASCSGWPHASLFDPTLCRVVEPVSMWWNRLAVVLARTAQSYPSFSCGCSFRGSRRQCLLPSLSWVHRRRRTRIVAVESISLPWKFGTLSYRGSQWGGEWERKWGKRTTTKVVVRFGDALSGPPTSWVPPRVSTPQFLRRASLSRPYPCGKGRGGCSRVRVSE